MSKWKQIESYMESKSFHESKFNINKKQAQMILDLKKDELKKMRFLAMLDIDKDELKQLAKKDPSIIRAIGKQGGSFRTAMVRKRANEELDMQENNTKKYIDFLKKKGFADVDKMVSQAKRLKLNKEKYITSFHSKFGFGEWTKPYTERLLLELPKKGIRSIGIVSPSFSIDCLETLEEIAIQFKEEFIKAGGEEFTYISCLNDNNDHVALIEKLMTC